MANGMGKKRENSRSKQQKWRQNIEKESEERGKEWGGKAL